MIQTIVLVIQVIAALGLIGLVLLQQGKGADAGASFGSGASQTVFGSSGSGNFLTRTTAILATLFFLSSLGLAYFAKHSTQSGEIHFDTATAPTTTKVEKASVGDLPAAPVVENKVAPASDLPAAPEKKPEQKTGK